MSKYVSKIHQIESHRNGVAGAPFHIIKFQGEDREEMLAIVFEEAHHVAVISLEKLPNINFTENSWRGDYFEAELRMAIAQEEVQIGMIQELISKNSIGR